MRDKIYLVIFLLVVGFLLYLGRDAIRSSVLVSWALTFGGITAVAILIVSLYRFRIELEASRHELARKEAEISVALKVQEALFPRQLPSDRGLQFSAVCIPARGISGDYYDILSLPDGRIAFAVADVSGKGISAAILMSNVQALLRVISTDGSAPHDVCKKLNDHLCQVTSASQFVTLFYAHWDPAECLMRYVNAGHNPPILLGRTRTLSLDTGGVPLGIFADPKFETGEARLELEDLIVLYSDGITEAGQSEDHDFGEERLKTLVLSMRNLPLPEIQEKVMAAVRSWAGREPEDDMTLVLVRAIEEGPQQ